MRAALKIEKLKTVYNRAAKRYDIQHQLLTAWSDQRGRKMVVKHTVRSRFYRHWKKQEQKFSSVK